MTNKENRDDEFITAFARKTAATSFQESLTRESSFMSADMFGEILNDVETAPILRAQKIHDENKFRLMSPADEQFFQNKKFNENALKAYLDTCDSALVQARGDAVGVDGDDNGVAVGRARLIWSILQRARLFIINPLQFGRFYQAADRYTCHLAGLDWNPPVEDCDPGGSEKLFETYRRYGENLPFPSPLPFDAMFISYGTHMGLSPTNLICRIRPDVLNHFGVQKAFLYGHILAVVGETPWAFSVVAAEGEYLTGRAILLGHAFDNGGWTQPASLDCWVLNTMVGFLNDHKTVTQENPITFGMKLDVKKYSKKLKTYITPPKPFYTLTLRDHKIDYAIRKSLCKKLREFSHRWDVRGHECVRFMRGMLPLDPKLEKELKKRNYRIYTSEHLSQEDFDRIVKRKIPNKQRDEWFAVLHFWRDEHIKGSPELPYIPAMRKTEKIP